MDKIKIPAALIADSFLDRLDKSGKEQLDEWLQQPGNVEIYHSVERLWNETRREVSGYEPDVDKLWKVIRRDMYSARGTHSSTFRWVASSIAAAVVLISVTLFFLPLRSEGDDLLVSVEAYSGKTRTVLPDGSSVWLKDGAVLDYDMAVFGDKERKVSLKGEAFFDVSKDPSKPFMVQTGGLTISVTGTSFNIGNHSGIAVSLYEGSVVLSCTGGQKLSLSPGDKAVYEETSGLLYLKEEDISADDCWIQDELSFKDRSLYEICQSLSVWYGVRIELAPDLETKYSYTFTVRKESLDTILDNICKVNPLRHYVSTDGIYHIVALGA